MRVVAAHRFCICYGIGKDNLVTHKITVTGRLKVADWVVGRLHGGDMSDGEKR